MINWGEGSCCNETDGLKVVAKSKNCHPFKYRNMVSYFKPSNPKPVLGKHGAERVSMNVAQCVRIGLEKGSF